jgi:hypothetical protein
MNENGLSEPEDFAKAGVPNKSGLVPQRGPNSAIIWEMEKALEIDNRRRMG